MDIDRDEQITGAVARQIRQDLGRSQVVFWGAVGIKRDTGNNYERRGRLPEPVRRLVFMKYIAGIPVDAAPDELVRVGRLAMSSRSAIESLAVAKEQARCSAEQLETAIKAIKAITEKGDHHG